MIEIPASEKEYELVWHVLDNDRAWFADHPDRQHRVRPLLWGEGTATRLKGRVTQVDCHWFVVRRDLQYAAFNPVAPPPDDEELCRLLFLAHVGLGGPKARYVKKAQQRWLALLEQMPTSEECELIRSLLGGESYSRPHVRKTGAAADNNLAETFWQD